MAPRVEINAEGLKQWYEEGLNDDEIGKKFGVSRATISNRRKALGLPAKHHGGWHSRNGSKPGNALLREVARKSTIIESNLVKADAAEVLRSAQDDDAAATAPNGHAQAKCRVVMFEITAGDGAILAAIETVKAALSNRAG